MRSLYHFHLREQTLYALYTLNIPTWTQVNAAKDTLLAGEKPGVTLARQKQKWMPMSGQVWNPFTEPGSAEAHRARGSRNTSLYAVSLASIESCTAGLNRHCPCMQCPPPTIPQAWKMRTRLLALSLPVTAKGVRPIPSPMTTTTMTALIRWLLAVMDRASEEK